MKKLTSLLLIIFFSFTTNVFAEKIKRISEGKQDAKITIIAYESLTCGTVLTFIKMFIQSLKKIL